MATTKKTTAKKTTFASKKKNIFTNKTYKLTRNKAPLSYSIPSRHTKRKSLLWFDEETGLNRTLRYSKNQKSIFEDEQDKNVILEPIVFEDGLLFVPKENQILQKFLAHHPGLGNMFVEVDKEKDASTDVSQLDLSLDAQIAAKELADKEFMKAGGFGEDTQSDAYRLQQGLMTSEEASNYLNPSSQSGIIKWDKNNPKSTAEYYDWLEKNK